MKKFVQYVVEDNNFLSQWDNEEPKDFVIHLTKKLGSPDEITS